VGICGGQPCFEIAASTKSSTPFRNLPRRTPTRDLHVVFKIPYFLYDFVKKNYAYSRQQSYKIMKVLWSSQHWPRRSSTQKI